MIKNLFTLFVLGIGIQQIQSQSNFEIGGGIGVELNFVSSFNPTKIDGYSALPGPNINFRVRHNFPKLFSLIGALEYGRVYQNFSYYSPDPLGNPIKKTESLIGNQIRLPFVGQLNIGQKKIQFFANLGLCIIFSFADYDFTKSPVTPSHKLPLVNYYNAGGVSGMGISYKPNELIRVFSELRMVIPFAPNPVFFTDPNNTARMLNLTWQFGFGLVIPKYID